MRGNICIKLIVLSFILSSCSTPSHWSVKHTETSQPIHKSSRLYFSSDDKYNGVDVEILRNAESTYMFLIVHSHPVTCCDENEKLAFVNISSDSFAMSVKAHRHQGGQRILLPSEVYTPMISALMTGQSLKVEMGGYKSEIVSDNFSTYYKKWEKPPPFIFRECLRIQLLSILGSFESVCGSFCGG